MPRYEPQPGLAQAIRRLRSERELTQEKVSERAGMHLTYISHLESGEVNPTLGNLKKLAHGLGITLVELAARIEEMDAHKDAAPRQKGRTSPGG